jgi:hypothetical protein
MRVLLSANLRGPANWPGRRVFLGWSPGIAALRWTRLEHANPDRPISIHSPFAVSPSVPQPGSSYALDSLGPRLMHPLQYRNLNGQESLWTNHTVTNAGVAGIRWYEIGNLNGTPGLVQQGTFQPDNLSRWMGSLAVDQDGNMALGYSVSSLSVFPGIRYTGRLNGELPGTLTGGRLGGGRAARRIPLAGGLFLHVDRSLDGAPLVHNQYSLSSARWQAHQVFPVPTCGPKARSRV